MNETFRRIAHKTTEVTGSAWAFIASLLVILAWLVTGPIFHFSDTWQLVINTGTTIITFLMVFLIQNAQNRDAKAIHLKLDELIRALKNARNEMINLEDLDDQQMTRLEEEFRCLRALQRILGKRLLPPDLDTNRKQGFSIPMDAWLRQDGCQRVRDTMSYLPDTIDRGEVESLISGQMRGRANGSRLYALIMLGIAAKNNKW